MGKPAMSTLVNQTMVDHYLSDITVGWFARHDLPADEVDEYRPYVENIRQLALTQGDLDYLKVGLEYLLLHPEVDLEAYNGGRYPFDADEMREIIEFVYRTLWPEESLPEQPPEVKLIQMPLSHWWSGMPGTP
jgi:hypothetical protein